jgi:signal transduction histidine kinase
VGEGRHVHRVAWAPGPTGGWIVLGVRAATEAALVRRATVAIAATATALVALLGTLAWAITSRATGDLTRLAAELETIEAGSLDRRLATRSTTEVNRVVQVLNRVLARLESAVTNLKRFTADAAHELRTPLAALRAHLEGSIARAMTAEDRRIGLVDALEQAERLQRLSEDLLTLSAVESDAANRPHADQRVRLDVLVREVADALRPIAEEQGRPFASDASAPVTVYGVAPLLKRVVVNLIDNAFRHTPEEAPIRVTLRSRAADAVAVLTVEDRGPGMAPAELGTVFERFRKGRASGGSGLGLALAREIAHRHGGSVALVSSPEGGTIATLLVPLATPPASV